MKKVKIKTPEIIYIRNTQELKKAKLKMQFNKRFNIYLGEKLTEKTRELFFGKYKYEDEGFILLHYKNNPFWSQILRDVGIAKSISEANGAGWKRKVEFGFQDILLDNLKVVKEKWDEYHNPKGFRPNRITVLNELKEETKP